MWWLIRRVLVLFAISTTVILTSRLVGSAQSLPFSALFTYPDGSPCESPCLFGVRPGYTTHEDAIALLRSHPLTQNLSHWIDESGVDNFGGEYITISIAPDVSWISIRDYRPTFHVTSTRELPRGTLADVILLFGAPEAVELSNQLYCFHLGYRLLGQYQHPVENHIDRQLPLLELIISAQPMTGAAPSRKPWQGFTSASLYLRNFSDD
jgi:hypothetical protein